MAVAEREVRLLSRISFRSVLSLFSNSTICNQGDVSGGRYLRCDLCLLVVEGGYKVFDLL